MQGLSIRLTAYLFVIMLALSFTAVSGQTELLTANPNATFTAYRCTFAQDRNTSIIRASLVGGDGLPIPRNAYSLTVTAAETGDIVENALIEANNVLERPPLEMILVLDTTDTMAIESVVNAIERELFPQLQVQDRVALITFAEDVFPRTQFYTDKNRLLNEHMIDLTPGIGDNRLYDAVYEAVTEFPLNTSIRQAVVVLTDSNRREIEQRPLDDIILRADRQPPVQIYSIGINSFEDQPNIAELERLGNETGGYTWVVDSDIITRQTIEDGVADVLDELATTLNSEILIRVDLDGLEPNENGFIRFRIDAATSNDATLSDLIDCPVEQLFHFIGFEDDAPEGTILGPVDIAVDYQSDLPGDETEVFLLVNGEVEAQNDSGVFRFNDPPRQPGYYTIGAQLRSSRGEVLATTAQALEIYIQPDIELNIADGYFGELTGEVRFEVQAEDPSFELSPVEFTVAPQQDPAAARPLIQTPIPFQDGVAVLVIDNIQEQVSNLFPDSEYENFVVRATVPGGGTGDPVSTALFEVFVPRPVEVIEEAPVMRPQLDWNPVFWAFFLMLLLINLLLFRAVGRARVRYRINHPDRIEMNAQLMTITVRREGVKQSHTLTKKTVTVGRGSSNDINLGDDPNISRNHGVIMWRRGNWYYSNRKRRALARVNGKRRIGYVWQRLVPITELEIGNALLIFHSNAQQDVSEFIKTNL